MKLIIEPAVRQLGIGACMALVKGAAISNKSNPLEKRKKAGLEKIAALEVDNNPVLQAYCELYARAGLEGFIPPAQHLINLAKKNGRLPNINTVVDCYNLISAETCLSIGAHDTSRIKGDVAFRITSGQERYTPLGEAGPVKVLKGEYACMDGEKIICRMDIKQCEETKVTKGTGEFIIYVQGNRNTPFPLLLQALQEICSLIQEICGGTSEIILAEN